MDEPRWIRKDAVLAIHRRQLAEHGGAEGLRDEGLLDSALAKPRHLLAYGENRPDVAELAAAYAYGLASNHPFIDGNKRVAYVVCRTFLLLNGADIEASPAHKYSTFMKLADGAIDQEELATWLRTHLRREPSP